MLAVLAVLAVLACMLIGSPAAMAIELTVNSTGDDVDAAPGNESCATAGGECTLRAAVEEGNAVAESTRIDFDEEVFEGEAADTILLGSSLPAIAVPAFLNGRSCETEAKVTGPCVGLDGPGGGTALLVGFEEVEISGLSVTGAQTGIELEGAPRSKVQGSWVGVALDGTLDGNGTGVLVGPGSNRGLIGGEGPGTGNVIAGNANDGLDVHGGNNVRVFGNLFGVEPDGVTSAVNGGDDIEVVSTGSEVTGTAIGTRVGSAAVGSPLCDGGCNVISGAGASGIDLAGDGGSEVAAASTSIAGNYIGLDAGGAVAVPNAGAGIDVGEAAHTVIGGPAAGEANRINGGSAAVLAGPAAPDLAVRGNIIGLDATGEATLDPPEDGIVVDSAELSSPAVEAEVSGNTIGMEGGVAIANGGEGAWIHGNEILGSQTAIRVFESSVEHANVVEGNLIEGTASAGILIETNGNEIVGNEIVGAGEAGIRVLGGPPFGVSGNLIGGDTPADENTIDNSGGAAVEITNVESSMNEVARNRGAGNEGPFIDLVRAGEAEPAGPNGGILPPAFSSTSTGAAGEGAEPGAIVRVFAKETAAAGELASSLGEGTVDPDGEWQVLYEDPVPGGAIVAASQTSEGGGTSELATAAVVGPVEDGGCAFIGGPQCGGGLPSGGDGAGGSAVVGGGPIGRFWPRTTILAGPRKRSRGRSVRFAFESDEPGSRFLCKLDGRPFDLCRSPRRYTRLAPGRHMFQVRAVDPDGHLDPTPAKMRFTVLR